MSDVTIKTLKNGPLLVQGPVKLVDWEGTAYTLENEPIALCRCGQSGNKPFCDGTHKTVGFEAAETAG